VVLRISQADDTIIDAVINTVNKKQLAALQSPYPPKARALQPEDVHGRGADKSPIRQMKATTYNSASSRDEQIFTEQPSLHQDSS